MQPNRHFTTKETIEKSERILNQSVSTSYGGRPHTHHDFLFSQDWSAPAIKWSRIGKDLLCESRTMRASSFLPGTSCAAEVYFKLWVHLVFKTLVFVHAQEHGIPLGWFVVSRVPGIISAVVQEVVPPLSSKGSPMHAYGLATLHIKVNFDSLFWINMHILHKPSWCICPDRD